MAADPDDLAAFTAKDYADQVEAVAQRLERLAEKVRQWGNVRTDIRTLRLDFNGSARDILHEIMWGQANLHLDDLFRRATDAQAAVDALPEETP